MAAIAGQLADPVARALAASLRARVAWATGDPDTVRLSHDALRLSQESGDKTLVVLAYDGLAEALDMIGNDRGVIETGTGGCRRAFEFGGANYGAWLLTKA